MKQLILAGALSALTSIAMAQEGIKLDATGAKIDGNMVTGIDVRVVNPGYLVLHDNAAGAPPNNLGFAAIGSGTTNNVTIQANAPLDPANGISVMLHDETNGNSTYDFGPGSTDVDTPVALGTGVVMEMIPAN